MEVVLMEFLEKLSGCENPDLAVALETEQVLISRNDAVCFPGRGTFKEAVVIRILANDLKPFARLSNYSSQVDRMQEPVNRRGTRMQLFQHTVILRQYRR